MAGQQQQGGQPDNSLGLLWILIGIFVAILLAWYIGHGVIVAILFKLRLFELYIPTLVSNSAKELSRLIANFPPQKASFTTVMLVSNEVGKYIRIPLVAVMAIFTIISISSSAQIKFKKTYSMKTLLAQEKENWPYVNIVDGLDLVKQELDEGIWAMAMTPVQFCKKNKLLDLKYSKEGGSGLKKDVHIKATVIQGKANKIFSNQLGSPWQGVEKLKPHVKALLTIFLAKADGETQVAENLLRQIGGSAKNGAQGGLNFSNIDQLYEKHKNSKIYKKVLNAHAYELTVMASMLEASRMDGVLATAEFLWLKPIDRKLWYVLNSVGRQTVYTEIAGIHAHWLAEKEMGRAIKVPLIQQATIALEEAIAEIIYIPDEGEKIESE